MPRTNQANGSNSGDTSADIIISQILDNKEDNDWDFKSQQLTKLFDAGIVDPVKVTRTALQNAASCAGTLITTNYGIIPNGVDMITMRKGDLIYIPQDVDLWDIEE